MFKTKESQSTVMLKDHVKKVADYPILLVEDNPDDVIITQRAWKKGQIKNKLYVVNDGEQALNFLFIKGDQIGFFLW